MGNWTLCAIAPIGVRPPVCPAPQWPVNRTVLEHLLVTSLETLNKPGDLARLCFPSVTVRGLWPPVVVLMYENSYC